MVLIRKTNCIVYCALVLWTSIYTTNYVKVKKKKGT